MHQRPDQVCSGLNEVCRSLCLFVAEGYARTAVAQHVIIPGHTPFHVMHLLAQRTQLLLSTVHHCSVIGQMRLSWCLTEKWFLSAPVQLDSRKK